MLRDDWSENLGELRGEGKEKSWEKISRFWEKFSEKNIVKIERIEIITKYWVKWERIERDFRELRETNNFHSKKPLKITKLMMSMKNNFPATFPTEQTQQSSLS